MIIFATAVSLFGALWPFSPRQTVTHEYVLPTWGYTTVKDRFTGQMRCQVFQGRRGHPLVSYGQHAVVFHFHRDVDLDKAWYKLDSGEAKKWSADYPALTAMGVALDGDSLENPGGGLLIVPFDEVKGVHAVTVRVNATSRPRTFGLDGLGDAVASARAQGCDPDQALAR